MRRAQLALPSFDFKTKLAFGGAALTSNPKTARPVATRQAMHVVLRSSLATGARSFLRRAGAVEMILKEQAEKTGVRIYDVANAGNHLHLVVKAPSRRLFARFLRAITGLLARKCLAAERGQAWSGREKRGFWDARPFTRIVAWGRDYTRLRDYLMLNRIETIGLKRPNARGMMAAAARFLENPGLMAIGFEGLTAREPRRPS